MPLAIRLASALFFASGAAALIFEALWFRRAGLAFGNSVWASALVLSSFMAGMALGNAFAARRAQRLRSPLRVVAGLELAIALIGLLLVAALPLLGPALAPIFRPLLPSPWLIQPLRFAAAFLVMLAPAIAMGATLPILVHALRGRVPEFGHLLGRLYGWNTLGAMAGAASAELLWIPAGGIYGAAAAAMALNAIAAGGALLLERRIVGEPVRTRDESARPLSRRAIQLLAAAALSGGLALAFEVIWFRVIIQYLPNSSAMFAWMLAVVLGGIALGSLAAGRFFKLDPEFDRFTPAIAAGATGLALLSHASIPPLVVPVIEGMEALETPPGALSLTLGYALALCFTLMLPVSAASGLLFAMLGKRIEQEIGVAGRATGLLALCNSSGAAVGPLLAGFVLLPEIGVDGSTVALAAGYLAVAALAWNSTSARGWAAGATAVAVLALALFPFGLHQTTLIRLVRAEYGSHEEVVAVREGIVETAIITRASWRGETRYHRLITDGYTMAGQTLASSRYMRLFAYLPAALHPRLESALLISFGVGNTADALTELSELGRIDVVDISPEILELSDLVHAAPGSNPLDDPRVRVHIEDGRYFLQTTTNRYDLITAEPPPPAFAGVVNLYTREYFALIRERLTEGGFTSYWLPVSQMRPVDSQAITHAFCDVFPDCSLWEADPSDWILLGSRNASTPVSEERLEQLWQSEGAGATLQRIGFDTPATLGATFLADAKSLRDWAAVAPPLVDAHPERAPAVTSSWVRIPDEFQWIRDTTTRGERLSAGEVPGSLWPPDTLTESARALESANFIRHVLLSPPRPIARRLAELHLALSKPELRTSVAWILDSDEALLDIARRRANEGDRSAEVAWQLAIAALTERDFEAAAARFADAAPAGAPSRAALLQSYALVRAGHPAEAQTVAARAKLAESDEFSGAWQSVSDLIETAYGS